MAEVDLLAEFDAVTNQLLFQRLNNCVHFAHWFTLLNGDSRDQDVAAIRRRNATEDFVELTQDGALLLEGLFDACYDNLRIAVRGDRDYEVDEDKNVDANDHEEEDPCGNALRTWQELDRFKRKVAH